MPTSTRAQRELTETRLVQGQDDVEGANLSRFDLTEESSLDLASEMERAQERVDAARDETFARREATESFNRKQVASKTENLEAEMADREFKSDSPRTPGSRCSLLMC